jgi:hypothetical protein
MKSGAARTHRRVEQRQSNGWKALDSRGSVERHAMVPEKQFLSLAMRCALEENEEKCFERARRTIVCKS